MTEMMLNWNRSFETPQNGVAEKRGSKRFPIEREVRYKTLNRRQQLQIGSGKSLNISSSGVLFTSEQDLPVGTRIEISFSWPVQLNEICFLNLVASGRVTRQAEGQLALQIQKYEFRTHSVKKNNDCA